MLIDSYYQQDLKSLRLLSIVKFLFQFPRSHISFSDTQHFHTMCLNQPMPILSIRPPLIVEIIPPLHQKGMSLPIPLTIIQTAKHIILWSQNLQKLLLF